MNEHDLSEALRDAVPPRPSTRGWADRARRRARTRRVGTVAAALMTVAAIATPLALQIDRDPTTVLASPSPAAPSPSPTVAPAAALVPDICRDPVTDARPLVDGDLPAGATRVWLCGRTDPGSIAELVGAPDALVAYADDAVAAFNALERSEGVLDCMPNPLDYTVVVEYRDGGHRAVRIAGCGGLRDVTGTFDTFRADGTGYLTQLRKLWTAEREETGFEFDGVAGLCDAATSSVYRPLAVGSLTRAVVCRLDGSAAELDGVLTADLLAALLEESTELGDDAAPTPTLPDLVLLTATGDPVSLAPTADGGYWWDEGTGRRGWLPSDAELLKRILEAQGQGGGPATPAAPPTHPGERVGGLAPQALVPQVCDDIQRGDLPVEDLPASASLPDGAARVWLCGDLWKGFGGVGPIEPLTVDPDRVVAAVNALPPATSDVCTLIGGLTYHLVIDYPDGAPRVVSAETVNCEFVGGADGRTGGARLLRDLLALWGAQRAADPRPFTGEVALCGDISSTVGLNSIVDVERASLYRGVICGLPAAGDGDKLIQRELPDDFVIALTKATATPADQRPIPEYSPYLVLYNQFGDPVTYPVDEALRVQFPDGAWDPNRDGTPNGNLSGSWSDLLSGLRGGTP